MFPVDHQRKLLQDLFEDYANCATSRARLSLSLNSTMSQLDELQSFIDSESLDIIRGSMIDLYDRKFSFRYLFYPTSELIEDAKNKFLLRLLHLNQQ